VLSEFYQLRRTTIKDLAAYCGFLIGFIGSAPFAWPRLTAEIDRGNFVLGLWYFFGLVSVAAIATGILGLAAGFVIGWLWERYHRYMRARRSTTKSGGETKSAPRIVPPATSRTAAANVADEAQTGSPRLHLVGADKRQSPDLVGRRLDSVRFLAHTVEFEFGGDFLGVSGDTAIIAGGTRIEFPEAGSRDALCRLIGSRVERMRRTPSGDIELDLDSGWGLVLPRPSAIVHARQ